MGLLWKKKKERALPNITLERTMSSTGYKLTYFNGRGRAETARFIFAQAGQEYTDERVTGEEFGKLKPTLPTGCLPVLTIDCKDKAKSNTVLSGSRSIARYLGEKFGFGGDSAWDNAQLDSIIDVIDDFGAKLIPAFFGSDEDAKAAAKKALLETHLPKYFEILEKRVAANNSPDGWVYDNRITYVDMRISITFDIMAPMVPDLADKFPALNKLNDAVKTQPKIAEWLKNRPETPF